MTPDPDLDTAYSLETPDDNKRLYAGWAKTYDRDFAQDMAYQLPLIVAKAYMRASGQANVLDIGAGTGLCGAALRELGVSPIAATDLSQDMLDVAAAKGIYDHLFAGNLLTRLPVENDTYAGAVSSGTFTHGHVGPEALDEVLRVVIPGGVIALSVNCAHWDKVGFETALINKGPKIIDLTWQDRAIYGDGATGDHADDLARIVTFRRGT